MVETADLFTNFDEELHVAEVRVYYHHDPSVEAYLVRVRKLDLGWDGTLWLGSRLTPRCVRFLTAMSENRSKIEAVRLGKFIEAHGSNGADAGQVRSGLVELFFVGAE